MRSKTCDSGERKIKQNRKMSCLCDIAMWSRVTQMTQHMRMCVPRIRMYLRTSLGSCSFVSLRARFTHFTLLHVSRSSGKLTWYKKLDRPPLKWKENRKFRIENKNENEFSEFTWYVWAANRKRKWFSRRLSNNHGRFEMRFHAFRLSF